MTENSKTELRKQFKAKRLALDEDEFQNLNAKLLRHFEQISFDGVSYIHTFLPILKQKEPNTFLLIEYLRSAYPAIQVLIPKSDVFSNDMTHHVYEQDQPLLLNAWGIAEPISDQVVAVELIDMVLVPLLVFDKNGHRVGYGKGYYDQFLGQCRKETQKIGLSFFDPVEQINEVDLHDVPLDMVVTPEKIWDFRS